ncbi:MAG: BamA/TamA family outer membrane protein [candidate division Zixibacteria bacterium]|nr:BamA/TamA family outer membrane protein [candidate division Zixibacteria bacterium]
MLLCFGCCLSVAAVDFDYRGGVPVNKSVIENGFNRLMKNNAETAAALDSVSVWLSSTGYLDNVVSSENNRIMITAGERYRLEKLVVRDSVASEFTVNEYFTRVNLDQAVERLLRNYYDLGYYFARADIAAVKQDRNRVTVELAVNKGPLVTVGRQVFHGLHRVQPDIVRRYLADVEGDTLCEDVINRSEKAASEIPFVTFQPPLAVRPEPGFSEVALEYSFVEPRPFRFVGGGGYIPDDPTGLVWNINLTLRNLFGRGREININSERREKGRNILDLSYRQPLFVLGVDRIEFNVKTRDYREQFYEFSLGSDYRTRLRPGFNAGLKLGWKRVEPSAALGYAGFSTGFVVERQYLDNRFNPSGGFSVDWLISYTYRRYSADSLEEKSNLAFNETRTELSLNFYQTLKSPLVFHLGLNYRGLESGESLPPVAELYFVGGPGTVRSFRNEQFIAQRTAFGTLEPRVRFGQGYFMVFSDAAYINRKTTGQNNRVTTEELFRWGYGFGLALSDRTRSVVLTLGWNEDLKLSQPRLSIELSADI